MRIIHETPKALLSKQFDSDSNIRVNSGDSLHWSAEGETSELKVCREFRTVDEDEISSNETCDPVPKNYCTSTKNFVTSSNLFAKDAGVFDYYFFASDKALNETDIECRRITIKENEPTLSLSWSDPNWNKPHAALQYANRELSASLEVKHPNLLDEDLRSSMECKVEFAMDGVSILPGIDARCNAGRCMGRTLEDFQPCDEKFRFSLVDYWKKYSGRASQLKIYARLKSVAGSEVSQSLWLHPSRYGLRSEDIADPISSVVGFFEDTNGVVHFSTVDKLCRRPRKSADSGADPSLTVC